MGGYQSRRIDLISSAILSVVAGIFSHSKLIGAKPRALLQHIHQWTGWFGFLFGILHGIVLTIDSYEPFRITELLIPFLSDYKPLATGMGILSFYMFIAVLITSDWMKKFGKRMWRTVHFLAFPAFVLSFLHGLLAGSDSSLTPARWMYALTGLIFLVAVVVRMKTSANKPTDGNSLLVIAAKKV